MLKEQVQTFLDNLKPLEHFTVVYKVKDGSQRDYTGHLLDSDKRSDVVPFQTVSDGIKSFNTSNVIKLELI